MPGPRHCFVVGVIESVCHARRSWCPERTNVSSLRNSDAWGHPFFGRPWAGEGEKRMRFARWAATLTINFYFSSRNNWKEPWRGCHSPPNICLTLASRKSWALCCLIERPWSLRTERSPTLSRRLPTWCSWSGPSWRKWAKKTRKESLRRSSHMEVETVLNTPLFS